MRLKPRLEGSTDRTKTLLWAAVVIVALIIFFMLLSDQLFFVFGFDTPDYILLAKSIASGHGYSDISTPGFPPQTQYPPGLPLLLAPVIYFLGYNLMWMHVIILFSGFFSLFIIKRLFETNDDKFIGIIIALLVLSNFYFIAFAREILSEVPYIFFSLLAVLFFEKYYADNSKRLYLALFILALVVSYFTKMIGITLYAGALTALTLRALKERGHGGLPLKKLVLFAIIAITPFLIFMLRNALLNAGGNTYQAIFFNADYYNADSGVAGTLGLFARIVENLGRYLFLPSRISLAYLDNGRIPPILFSALSLILLAMTLYGLFHDLLRNRGVKEFYIIFYLALVIAWPVYGLGDSFRYLVPIIPFLYYYLFIGIRLTAVQIRGFLGNKTVSSGKFTAYACLIFLAFNLMAQKALLFSSGIPESINASGVILGKNLIKRYDTISVGAVTALDSAGTPPCFVHYTASSNFLKSILRPGEVATARKAHLTALITGGYVLKFPFTNNMDKMLEFFIREKIDYVVLDGCYKETRRYIVPFMKKYKKFFEATNRKYPVFRFKRPGGPLSLNPPADSRSKEAATP